MSFVLSYVFTTYNKIEFFKVALLRAIENRLPDEEIVVVDGGSSDGTADYLEEVYQKGLIQQYVSEKDLGEGHGYNKGILMARGKVIKFLSDDDVFDFNVIRKCREFLLTNPDIDFLNMHGGWYDIERNNDIFIFTEIYINMMKEWMHSGKPFAFCTLGAMFNKNSLPLLGLLNPTFKRTDAEYSLRITAQKIKMSWYTGVGFVRILNGKSNSAVYNEKIKLETEKLNSFYDVIIDADEQDDSSPTTIKTQLKTLFRPVYSYLKKAKLEYTETDIVAEDIVEKLKIDEIFIYAEQWMREEFKSIEKIFIKN